MNITLHLFFILGTFLFDTELQREQNDVCGKTKSLWTYVNREEILRTLKNPLYDPNNMVLLPSVCPQSMVRN